MELRVIMSRDFGLRLLLGTAHCQETRYSNPTDTKRVYMFESVGEVPVVQELKEYAEFG